MGRRPGRKDRDNGKQKEKLSTWFPWNLGEWRSRAREGFRVMLCGWEVKWTHRDSDFHSSSLLGNFGEIMQPLWTWHCFFALTERVGIFVSPPWNLYAGNVVTLSGGSRT